MTFDPTTVGELRTLREVSIRASRPRNRSVVIWVVAVADAVYVRSVRGPKGLWYVAARGDGQATLEFSGRRVPVHVASVSDQATIDAVSQAFLTKYAGSPWAQSIVAPDTLATTLRLEPA